MYKPGGKKSCLKFTPRVGRHPVVTSDRDICTWDQEEMNPRLMQEVDLSFSPPAVSEVEFQSQPNKYHVGTAEKLRGCHLPAVCLMADNLFQPRPGASLRAQIEVHLSVTSSLSSAPAYQCEPGQPLFLFMSQWPGLYHGGEWGTFYKSTGLGGKVALP